MTETVSRRILVVDDDAAMRLAMTRVLERAGFEAESCADGQIALTKLTARPFAAMISDVRMPGIDGRELLGRALMQRPGLKVLMVTAFGTVQDAVDAVRRGACDYLLKPFAPEALTAALQRAFDDPATARGGNRGTTEPEMIGSDTAFRDLLDQAQRAAQTDVTVLLTGESGTGKELIARYVHANSPRKHGPFVAINCAALPAELLEAELFGVRRGAYTGADRDRAGHFERAHGGTLLLDEIGDLPLGLQAKLLRALEERTIVSLGAGEPRPIDIRVIAATHQDLSAEIASGQFRQDLYFRLCVIPLRVPALRERRADIATLAQHLASQICARLGRPVVSIEAAALARLSQARWPGNIRELRNVIERAVVLDRSGTIRAADLFLDETPESKTLDRLSPGMTVAEAERRLIERTLEATNGNRTRASELLGISVRTLRNKLRTFRVDESATVLIQEASNA